MEDFSEAKVDIECESAGIDAKVAFLKQPESYVDRPVSVEAIETHMAWVFIADSFAFKLKKPVRYEFLDFSTIAARRFDCHEEVRLNRRLAPDVYLGVVPLTQDGRGRLHIDGSDEPVDWLVKMRTLPRSRMLDRAIQERTVVAEDLQRFGRILSEFYRNSPPVAMSTMEYRGRLTSSIHNVRGELVDPSFGLNTPLIDSIARLQCAFIEDRVLMFDARIRSGHMIDAHGDLRPEHVCLETPPVIIDCLEFKRDFRLLDPASELSFLTLECDQLGAPCIGATLWSLYLEITGDSVPEDLLRFYRSYHAFTRAKIAISHLKDPIVRVPKSWKPKTDQYLELAAQAIGC